MANNKVGEKNLKQITIMMIPYLIMAIFIAKEIHIYNSGGNDRLGYFLEHFNDIISFTSWFSLKELLLGIMVSIVFKVITAVMSPPKKNFKHNVEYGAARWGNASDIAPYIDKNPDNNIILSATEKLSMNGQMPNMEHNRNKNIIITGGSGSGKTYTYVIPQLMQLCCSYVVTDPKGTILEKVGYLLKKAGYEIKVLNTINFERSMHYNPFVYIKSEKDILKCANALFTSLKAEDAGSGGDPFWDEAARLFLVSLFALIWYEAPEEEQNISTFLELLDAYDVSEDDENFKNGVDLLFEELEETSPKGSKHFAVRQYKKFKKAAGKTAKSILITVGSKLAPFDIDVVQDIMQDDELELEMLGQRKQVLFVIVSDTDKTFNFLPALLYKQMFDTLCYEADNKFGGELPVHVRCIFDEFANFGKIDDFQILIATIRSRGISAEIMLQSKDQLRSVYKDNAGIIEDNCDTSIFLGGKGRTTLEDLEKNLGEETIDLFNESDTRGMSPSKGLNYNKVGRKLMSVFELNIMPRSKCIVQISGIPPFYSNKYVTKNHPRYKWLGYANKKYRFDVEKYIKNQRKSKKLKLNKKQMVKVYS